MKTLKLALLGLLACTGPAQAQTKVPGDANSGDPSGLLAEPCIARPNPTTGDGWLMWNIHMLTRDFGQLCRYRAQNIALRASKAPVRVVFMGDSITDNWIGKDASLFTDGLVDRGIGGQTTPQMLVRFREDVIALHPQAVHIMAGINDIAGNTGASTLEIVEGHIRSMAELARANGIKVILASTTPASAFVWAPDKRPVPQIAALNAWLRDYAGASHFTYVDYHAALVGPDGGMKPGLASDGVHPTAAGYAIMRPLTLAAIAKTLGK